MSRGSQAVYTEFATEVERQGLGAQVAQTQCGCIAPHCGQGPVVCVYPSGNWYAPVTPADVGELVGQDIAAGKTVTRLAINRVTTEVESV